MRSVIGILAAVLAGCGGGGGGPPPPIETSVDFQLVAADRPSTLSFFIPNPIPGFDADVELAPDQEIAGAFQPALGAFPGFVADGASFELRVRFDPPAPGPHEGGFTIRFRVGSYFQDVVVMMSAEVEALLPALIAPLLDFGEIVIGKSGTDSFTVRNPGQVTGLQVNALPALPEGFTYVAGGGGFSLAPGESRGVEIRYEPDALASHDFSLDLTHNAQGGPLRVDVRAETPTWITRQVHDFGAAPVTAGETDWFEVDVPPHGVSLSLEVRTNTGAVIGLLGLEGPDGTVYEDDQATGKYLWLPSSEGVFSATVPQNDDPAIQLAPGGGTYRFRFYLLSGNASTLDVRAIVMNRRDGALIGGRLDLNVFLAQGLGIEVADAPFDPRLQDVLAEVDRILGQHDFRLGDITYYRLNDPAFDAVTGAEFPDLLRQSAIAAQTRFNLFFVQTAFGGGVLGVAATIAGPAVNGTGMSGVMSDYDNGSVATAGYVAAHEIGHYLGLYHTTEQNGAHDIIADTLECPPTGTDAVCATVGNDNLMHWHVLNADPEITDGQANVILVHPLVDPPGGAIAGLRPAVAPGVVGALPPGWCGTPGCCINR